MGVDLGARPRARAHARSPAHNAPAHAREAVGERGPGLVRPLGLLLMAVAPAVLAVLLGPWDWLVPLPVVVVGVLLVRSRQRRQRRGHIEVAGSPLDLSMFWWRRQAWHDLRGVEERWEWIADRAGIPDAKLRRAVADADGYAFHLSAHGHLGIDADLPRLHSALGLARQFEVTTPDPLRPWEFVVSEVPQDTNADDAD